MALALGLQPTQQRQLVPSANIQNGRAMIRSKLRKTDSDGWHRVVANTSDRTLKDAAV
ncbi:hypothetical protein E4U44_006649 [Claviceps purpurea]|nr:hypothetical protein E4U44_006649 [Claviceps purpurea]